MDFAARYHRLKGDNVLFPQGWDCHGLPTEVKVEENNGIHRTDAPRSRFREMCIEHTEKQISAMRETMDLLGFSQDWSHEYRTMDPEYWGKTQQSFVEMADSGYVYRDEYPVNWCPRCQTAIADAEVENEDREGSIYQIRFEGIDNDDIEIATTRPELLAACGLIAVDPDDERYTDRIGDTFEVPLFSQTVELVSDEEVDSEFGSGAVMICTFGDKQDVDWWAKYDISLRDVINEKGHLTEEAGEFAGESVSEAKESIATALEESGHLVDRSPHEQSVSMCWRCDTPIEILSKKQWFIRIDQEEILEKGRKVNWIPDHMYTRFEDWTNGLEWDWVVSRQRVFATPIPAWFCDDCGHAHLASVDQTPVDPTEEEPEISACPECGANEWTSETDVMDTWMDSSISQLHVAGWPDEEFEPVQLREQGHDIIRTWAFYSVLRTAALENEIPWEDALINGMVLGSDGHKMSKSKGNFVQPEEVVEEYSADAFRQAIALGGSPGSDVQVGMEDAKTAFRFLTKVWNILRFATSKLDSQSTYFDEDNLADADKWILTKFQRTSDSIDKSLKNYEFDKALRNLKEFVWHDLADDYVELIKGRLYEDESNTGRQAAEYTLDTVLSGVIRMLSIYAPFFAEEAWRHLPGRNDSVHRQTWPTEVPCDESAYDRGETIAAVASAVRSWKSDEGLSLNAPLDRLDLYDLGITELDTVDLSSAVNSEVYLHKSTPDYERVLSDVSADYSQLGPKFGNDTEEVVKKVENTELETLESKLNGDHFMLDVGGSSYEIPTEAFDLEYEFRGESGQRVEIIETDHATIVITPN